MKNKNVNFIVKRHVIVPMYSYIDEKFQETEWKNVDIVVYYNNVRTLIEYDGVTHRIYKDKEDKDKRFESFVKKFNLRLIRINARRFRKNKVNKLNELLELIKNPT